MNGMIKNISEKKKCLLIGHYCNEEHKNCNKCIAEEDAWQRLQYYIGCHNYDWAFDRIKHDYQKYYLNGSYCIRTLMDIIKNDKNDCKMLFGLEKWYMKKFEENGFTATVTDKVVRWEIPISSLIEAFNNSPENYSDDGEHYITVKWGKKQEFAEYVAQQLMLECDSGTGASHIENAIENVFLNVFEGDEDFANYPMYDN